MYCAQGIAVIVLIVKPQAMIATPTNFSITAITQLMFGIVKDFVVHNREWDEFCIIAIVVRIMCGISRIHDTSGHGHQHTDDDIAKRLSMAGMAFSLKNIELPVFF